MIRFNIVTRDAAVFLVVLPGMLSSVQVPIAESTIEVEDPVGLVLGGSVSIVSVGREAFEGMDRGYGIQLVVGSRFKPFADVRAGVGLSSHSDQLAEGRAKLLSVYLEAYIERVVSSVSLRVAPRVAWMRVSRSISFLSVQGFGVGAVVGAQLALGSHGSIETGVALTLATMGTDGLFGGRSENLRYGTALEFRLGGAYRL